jgi:peroxiredoxin
LAGLDKQESAIVLMMLPLKAEGRSGRVAFAGARRGWGLASAAVMLSACAGPAATGAATSATAVTPAEGTTKEGGMASDFAARDIEGKTVRLSDYLGKQAVLLDFWTTFCEPCLAEIPHLRRIYDEEKGKGFVVIAISMDGPETVADVPSFAKRNGMLFPVLLDEDSHIVSIYNPKKSAPLSVLIDRNGRVFRVREGYNPGDERFVQADIDKVLQLPLPDAMRQE